MNYHVNVLTEVELKEHWVQERGWEKEWEGLVHPSYKPSFEKQQFVAAAAAMVRERSTLKYNEGPALWRLVRDIKVGTKSFHATSARFLFQIYKLQLQRQQCEP